jgi:uncharacterized protein YxeA
MDMKKLLFIIALCFTFIHTAIAGDQYRIKVLKEISYNQAQNHPRKWEISTYTYKNYNNGYKQTRYFIFAPNIKHDSTIQVIKKKGNACPWMVSINGMTYYADFDNEDEIKVGDEGVLKYNGSTLYFVKD